MNLSDVSFSSIYILLLICFSISMGFLAVKGRKVSAILLSIFIPKILGTILTYTLIQILPFLLNQFLIFLIVIPLICFILTFIILIKINFLRKIAWLNHFHN